RAVDVGYKGSMEERLATLGKGTRGYSKMPTFSIIRLTRSVMISKRKSLSSIDSPWSFREPFRERADR
ncbi:MAG: hypothetical protein ABSH45_18510, partial [Bryobacteraceae bacterium]